MVSKYGGGCEASSGDKAVSIVRVLLIPEPEAPTPGDVRDKGEYEDVAATFSETTC